MEVIRIFGWLLLIVGLLIIGGALYSSYNIFTGKMAAPEIFKLSETKTSISERKITEIKDIQAQFEQMITEQLKEVLPVDILPKMLNLISWSILAGLLIFGGTQISSLGIKLLKK